MGWVLLRIQGEGAGAVEVIFEEKTILKVARTTSLGMGQAGAS